MSEDTRGSASAHAIKGVFVFEPSVVLTVTASEADHGHPVAVVAPPLAAELADERGFKLQTSNEGSRQRKRSLTRSLTRSIRRSHSRKSTQKTEVLYVTTNIDCCLGECDHLLLYLTSQTWTRGDASNVLADEVRQAMDLGVHVLLAHESEQRGDGIAVSRTSICARGERRVFESLVRSARSMRAGCTLWLRIWLLLLLCGRRHPRGPAQARHLLGGCDRAQGRTVA